MGEQLEGLFGRTHQKRDQNIYAYNKFRTADNSCHLCELKMESQGLCSYTCQEVEEPKRPAPWFWVFQNYEKKKIQFKSPSLRDF